MSPPSRPNSFQGPGRRVGDLVVHEGLRLLRQPLPVLGGVRAARQALLRDLSAAPLSGHLHLLILLIRLRGDALHNCKQGNNITILDRTRGCHFRSCDIFLDLWKCCQIRE